MPLYSRNLFVHGLLRYWIEQVESQNDFSGARPIVIVGTHADKLSKQEQVTISNKVEKLYPIACTRPFKQIHGHFVLQLTPGNQI